MMGIITEPQLVAGHYPLIGLGIKYLETQADSRCIDGSGRMMNRNGIAIVFLHLGPIGQFFRPLGMSGLP